MPFYLSRFSYTPETWARPINNPEDRREAAQLSTFGSFSTWSFTYFPDGSRLCSPGLGRRGQWRRADQLADLTCEVLGGRSPQTDGDGDLTRAAA